MRVVQTFWVSMKVLKIPSYIHLIYTYCHKLNTGKRTMWVVDRKLKCTNNSAYCKVSNTISQRNNGFKRSVASFKDYLRCDEN